MPSLRTILAFIAEVAFVIASIFTNIPESWRVYAVGSSWVLLLLSVIWYLALHFGLGIKYEAGSPKLRVTIAICSVLFSFLLGSLVWRAAAWLTKAAQDHSIATAIPASTIPPATQTDAPYVLAKMELGATDDQGQNTYKLHIINGITPITNVTISCQSNEYQGWNLKPEFVMMLAPHEEISVPIMGLDILRHRDFRDISFTINFDVQESGTTIHLFALHEFDLMKSDFGNTVESSGSQYGYSQFNIDDSAPTVTKGFSNPEGTVQFLASEHYPSGSPNIVDMHGGDRGFHFDGSKMLASFWDGTTGMQGLAVSNKLQHTKDGVHMFLLRWRPYYFSMIVDGAEANVSYGPPLAHPVFKSEVIDLEALEMKFNPK